MNNISHFHENSWSFMNLHDISWIIGAFFHHISWTFMKIHELFQLGMFILWLSKKLYFTSLYLEIFLPLWFSRTLPLKHCGLIKVTVSTKRKYTLLSRVLKTEGVPDGKFGTTQWGVWRTPYFSHSPLGLWVLGFAVSVYFLLVKSAFKVNGWSTPLSVKEGKNQQLEASINYWLTLISLKCWQCG